MERFPPNERPADRATCPGPQTDDVNRGQIIAAKQLPICACSRDNATADRSIFGAEQVSRNAAKIRRFVKAQSPAKGKECIPLPDLGRLRKLIAYDPETGLLTWRISRGGQRAGSVCGSVGQDGYTRICIDGLHYLAHRVAFKLHHGREPVGYVDHKNGSRSDNRERNLRELSPWLNNWHRTVATQSNSGTYGVCFRPKSGKYEAYASVGGHVICLGTYTAICCAKAARSHAISLIAGVPANDNGSAKL